MMDQRLTGLSAAQRHFERFADLPGVQTVMDVITDDLARPGIRHQTQIDKRSSRGQIGDVSDPYLLGSRGHNLLRTIFQ